MNKKLLEYFNNEDLPAGAWLGKYADEGEITPDDMHKRMAREFARVDYKYQSSIRESKKIRNYNDLSDYGKEREPLTEDKIYNFFKDFKYIIPQGSVMATLGTNTIASLSNCFVIGQPYDSYGGIMKKDEEQVQLMKRRGGVGQDISTLAPKGRLVNNAAKSSTGAISFMPRYSNTTREVAQEGRRGALMLSIADRHPDVFDFVKIKRDLTKITGANISVKLFDDFMEAVEKDEDFLLRFPLDTNYKPKLDEMEYNELYTFDSPNNVKIYAKKIKAKELWDEIIKSARDVAEPGLMFWDNMINYSPDGVYPQFKAITTNPCSEIGMQAYDACRLIVTNFFNFVKNPFTSKAEFDFEKFYKINYEAMRLSDDLIDLEIEHIDRILAKIESDPEPEDVKRTEKELWLKIKKTATASRRTGLGFTALGDTLAALGVKYDSDEGLELIESICITKMESELDCTIDLAIQRGTFEGWDWTKEFTVIKGQNRFYQMLQDKFPVQVGRMCDYGRRNVSWSTVAPTGTVSLLAQTTSGVEPLFMPFYIRRKKINPNDKNARIDFVDDNGDTWQEYPVLHPKFKDWISIQFEEDGQGKPINDLNNEDLQNLFETSPWYGSTANDIDWLKRVKIQGIIQKYITHSISSTINLPETVSYKEVSDIYMASWKEGLKGITVYRDGSRSGVMISSTNKDSSKFEYVDAVKRPKELKAESHLTKISGTEHNVVVGLLDNKPYEVFAFVGKQFNKGEGTLIKEKKGKYTYQSDTVHSLDIGNGMTDEQAALTRMISTSLRHGADIKFIVEQLNKADGELFSFTKAIARTLKKYIPDGAKSTVKCNDCGSDNVIFEEGCHKCLDCGSSKCG